MPGQNHTEQGRRQPDADPVAGQHDRGHPGVCNDRPMRSSGPDAPSTPAERASARDRILHAAEELFAEKGFDRTPTSRIAKQAGVPHGLIFYHFPTKMDLLLTLVRDYANVFTAGLEASARPHEPNEATFREAIENLWADLRDQLQSHTRVRQIVFQELAAHPEIRQQAQALQATGTSIVATRLAATSGHPQPSPAHLAAGRLIVSTAVLGTVLHPSEDTGLDPHALAALLTSGLPTAPPE
jgi:AcrR family transcriptional regulator